MLKATAITHRFGAVKVLDHADLFLAPGQIAGLVGPSGTGKSTLGRILAGHLAPLSGHIEADGAPVGFGPGRPCPVQYAPQASELSIDPRWRVGRILENGGAPDQGMLEALGIRPEWRDRFPRELSGGELARVSLARLVLPTTRYLICDEITAPLDALSAEDMMTALRALARRGMGILVISHNYGFLRRHADLVMQLQHGKFAPAGIA
ncbi:nickel ABC transporter ATP-binding protein [Roseibium aquae]|uniref:Nickel ABC transporter ATP-binding protein n=1 Tax=Roseibium aquae TaxID=1323746 RepID=A0A916TM34_9HYPH|nr:ATP-binding cassette domain-containing protein [Roseibium aquae]GGB56048.1 nickel ABC transporter ATP-binding protein [Roseibium aquae]